MANELLASTFVIQNALLSSRLSKRVGNRLSAHGISFTEYLVMQYLDALPHKSVSRIELAEHLGMSASGVTRLIAPMEKNRVVEKVVNPRDARQSQVQLSKPGQRLYAEAKVTFDYVCSELLDSLTQSQQERLIELCAKVT